MLGCRIGSESYLQRVRAPCKESGRPGPQKSDHEIDPLLAHGLGRGPKLREAQRVDPIDDLRICAGHGL